MDMAAEMFHWQKWASAWRGPAIYHVTIAAFQREPLFAVLSGTEEEPFVEKTDLGWALVHNLTTMCAKYPQIKLLADQVMPNHFHMVLQVTASLPLSIKEVVRGYMQGCKAEARHLGRMNPLFDGAPFLRPLSHKGQLRAMIDYTKSNPRRALARRNNPNLFRLHRHTVITLDNGKRLEFTSMGNHFMIGIPTCVAVACSRSMSNEQIQAHKQDVLQKAANGVVVYTAAISEGEKQIARAVREAGYPLVVLLKDGFPQPGTEQERYYKPGGLYFEACSAGRLLLLEPTEATFLSSFVQDDTYRSIRVKAESRHTDFAPLPTQSARYRFMALNEIARMLTSHCSFLTRDTISHK